MDLAILERLIEAKGKPMGLSTIAATLSEDEGTVEDVIEPYLIANGYIAWRHRFPRQFLTEELGNPVQIFDFCLQVRGLDLLYIHESD